MGFIILMSALILGVIALVAREIILFRRKSDAYSFRRLTLRLSVAAMMICLLGSMLVGVGVFHLDNPGPVPRLWLAFWGFVGMLTGAILCLVIADFRLVRDDINEDSKKIWHEIAETIAENEIRRGKGAASNDRP